MIKSGSPRHGAMTCRILALDELGIKGYRAADEARLNAQIYGTHIYTRSGEASLSATCVSALASFLLNYSKVQEFSDSMTALNGFNDMTGDVYSNTNILLLDPNDLLFSDDTVSFVQIDEATGNQSDLQQCVTDVLSHLYQWLRPALMVLAREPRGEVLISGAAASLPVAPSSLIFGADCLSAALVPLSGHIKACDNQDWNAFGLNQMPFEFQGDDEYSESHDVGDNAASTASD